MSTDPHVDEDSPVNISKFASSVLGAQLCDIIWRYEKDMTRIHNQKYVAVRTRQQIIKNGILKTIRSTVSRRPTQGFKWMIAKGRPQDTYEWIALTDPRFKSVWEKAAMRLISYGVRGFPGYDRSLEQRSAGRPPRLAA